MCVDRRTARYQSGGNGSGSISAWCHGGPTTRCRETSSLCHRLSGTIALLAGKQELRAPQPFRQLPSIVMLQHFENRRLSRLHNKFSKSKRNRHRMPAGAVSSPSQPRQTRIKIGLKQPRRSTQCQLEKRNVKRNENAALHHETGLANQLLICAMQRHALGGNLQ